MTSYAYSVMRYVNDIVKDEPINIGVIITETNSGTFVGKMIDDVKLINKIHKDAGLGLVGDIVETWRGEHKLEHPLSQLAENFQHQIQFTHPRPSIGTNIYEELNDIYDQFVSIDKNFPTTQIKK